MFPVLIAVSLLLSEGSAALCMAAAPTAMAAAAVLIASSKSLDRFSRNSASASPTSKVFPGLLVILLFLFALWRAVGTVGLDRPPLGIPDDTRILEGSIYRDGGFSPGGGVVNYLAVDRITSTSGLSISADFRLRLYGGERRYLFMDRVAVSCASEGLFFSDVSSAGAALGNAEYLGCSSPWRWRNKARILLDGRLDALSLEHANYVKAVIFGYRSGWGSGFAGLLRDAGVVHLFVLSGFHLGIIYLMVRGLLPSVIPLLAREILANVLIWSYVCFITSSASVLRAAMAISIYSLLRNLSWQISFDLQLSIIWALMLLVNPEFVAQAGMYLSFSAVWGLHYASGVLELLLHRLNRVLLRLPGKVLKIPVKLFLPSASAQLGTMPFSLYYFSSLNLQGIIALPLVLPLFYLSMIFSVGLLLIPAVPRQPWLGDFRSVADLLLGGCIAGIENLCGFFARLGLFLGMRAGTVGSQVVIPGLAAVSLGGSLAFYLHCRFSGLLLSSSNVQLRFGGGNPVLSPGAEHGHAEEIRTEFHDQSPDAGENRLPDAGAARESGLGNRAGPGCHHQDDGRPLGKTAAV